MCQTHKRKDSMDKPVNPQKIVSQLLDELYSLEIEKDKLCLDLTKLKEALVPVEIRQKIAEAEASVEGEKQQLETKINEIRERVKTYTIVAGVSIKGAYLHAVFFKPKVTWDSQKLDGFAQAHPEILAFRKVGEPSIQIRKIT